MRIQKSDNPRNTGHHSVVPGNGEKSASVSALIQVKSFPTLSTQTWNHGEDDAKQGAQTIMTKTTVDGGTLMLSIPGFLALGDEAIVRVNGLCSNNCSRLSDTGEQDNWRRRKRTHRQGHSILPGK